MTRKEREARAPAANGKPSADSGPTTVRGMALSGGRTAKSAGEALQAGTRAMLELLCRRDDGWLRVVPGGDQKAVYFKWKFTRGKHPNHYVMAVVQAHQVDLGLQQLLIKMEEVDEGMRKPTPDKYFTWEDGETNA